jgi:hypothetical protein
MAGVSQVWKQRGLVFQPLERDQRKGAKVRRKAQRKSKTLRLPSHLRAFALKVLSRRAGFR